MTPPNPHRQCIPGHRLKLNMGKRFRNVKRVVQKHKSCGAVKLITLTAIRDRRSEKLLLEIYTFQRDICIETGLDPLHPPPPSPLPRPPTRPPAARQGLPSRPRNKATPGLAVNTSPYDQQTCEDRRTGRVGSYPQISYMFVRTYATLCGRYI